jgi:uncharacterized protein YhaN
MSDLFRKIMASVLCWVVLAPSALWAVPTTPTVATSSPVVKATASDAPVAKPVAAPPAQVRLLVRLSALEPCEALKPFADIEKPTDVDVTEALMELYPEVVKTDAPSWREAGVSASDTEELLNLVRQKKSALRAHGLSAWSFEKKMEKLTASYVEATPVASPTPIPSTPTMTPTPLPKGPDEAEFKALRERVKTLESETERAQSEAAIRLKAAEDAEKAKSADREAQREEARLLKGLVDDLQAGQKRLESSIDMVDKKADKKGIDDDELRQSLSIMRKDLRDNVQDVSVLKQKVEKLMAPEKTYAKPLDKALASKWIPGAALLIAVGAIVIAVSKK